MWNRIFALILKEIFTIWRDPKSRMVLISPPLMQLLIFSYAATLDVHHVPIGILNRDSGKESIELIQRFSGSSSFKNIHMIHSVQEIKSVIDNQKVVMVIHIDENFSKNIYSQKGASIQLILDGRKSNTAQIVLGYVSTIIEQLNLELSKKEGSSTQNSLLITRHWFNPNLLYDWFNVPNLCGIITMLVCIMVTSLSIARERELGTFDQLLVSPINPHEILLGKMIPALIFSLFEATLVIVVAIFLFHIPFTGSLWVLYLSLIVFASSIIGIGLFLSSLVKTQQQAILCNFIFISPAILLSGYATPIENMPSWLQFLDLANPLRYFLIITKGIFLKATPFHLVFMNLWPMAIIAMFTLAAATICFRMRLE